MTDHPEIFNRMSTSELSLFISKYGVSSLPRLTNHGSRIRAAMALLPCDEPQQLADAVARFQKEFDRMKREERKANWPQLQTAPGGGPRTVELYPCQCCKEQFRPFKFQVTRGNGLWCSRAECRKAARKSRKKTNREAA